jgi:hypothetical protein
MIGTCHEADCLRRIPRGVVRVWLRSSFQTLARFPSGAKFRNDGRCLQIRSRLHARVLNSRPDDSYLQMEPIDCGVAARSRPPVALLAGQDAYWIILLTMKVGHVMPKPYSDDNDDKKSPPDGSDDEAPEIPTDEPQPMPIQDPPSDATAPPPMTVDRLHGIASRWHGGRHDLRREHSTATPIPPSARI